MSDSVGFSVWTPEGRLAVYGIRTNPWRLQLLRDKRIRQLRRIHDRMSKINPAKAQRIAARLAYFSN